MRYTDKDVPIHCDYCNELVEGVENMKDHLVMTPGHMDDIDEAADHARILADNAYDDL